MNDTNPSPQEYEFRRSLKEARRYPFLELLRVERFLTRPLASLVVRAVFRSRVMPDHLTWASFFVGLLAAAAFLGGSHAYFIAGGILAQLGSILDCADGMLARARDQCTKRGAFLDLMLDRIIEFVCAGALAAGTYRSTGKPLVFFVCLGAVALYYLQATLYYLFLIYHKDDRVGRQAEVRGFSVFLTLLFCVLNRPQFAFYALFGEALISIVYQVFRFFRPTRS